MMSKKFCIVGYGQHAKNKIIPELKKKKYIISGIVSKKKKNLPYKIFKNIDDALSILDKKTIFLICSPPHIHAHQSEKIINNGFSVFIEKPIFTKSKDLQKIIYLSHNKKIFFSELMMYRYSKIYKKFIKEFKRQKKNISEIELIFTIPKYSAKTFRSKKCNYSINLFDIGCYPISLLNEIFKKIKLKISEIQNPKNLKKELIFINNTKNNKIRIFIKIGINKIYENKIIFKTKKNEIYSFYPFFYGREGLRSYCFSHKNNQKKYMFSENNSFLNLLSFSPAIWKKTQKDRNKIMLKNLSSLENLNIQYNKIVNKYNDIK